MTRRRALAVVLAILIGTVAVVVLTALVVGAVKATLVRGTQVSNTKTIDSSAKTLEIIEGCTTPGEACYERGQAQIADAVTNINEVVILAAACASEPGEHTVQDIQNCVITRLADRD